MRKENVKCGLKSLNTCQAAEFGIQCMDICDPSQQNRAVVCYQEKCDIPFI